MTTVLKHYKERRSMRIRSKATGLIAAAGALYVAATVTMAVVDAQQNSNLMLEPTSTKSLSVPTPPNLSAFVADEKAAVVLGKALFWDMQASSDNQMACASCHFHAGADNRLKNQLSPGSNNTFDPLGGSGKQGANVTLTAADFPFHRLTNQDDRDSTAEF